VISARARTALHRQIPRALEDLRALCRQPSVSAQNLGLDAAAGMVERLFRGAGAEVLVLRRPGAAPCVIADFAGGAGRPVLLFYNHYDVQPAEPLDLWTTPPFEPDVRDGRLFARGAADNKGDLLCRLAAVRALLEGDGGLPCRVRFLVEGEEEVGSPNLPAYIAEAGPRLAADACVWEFGGRDQKGRVDLWLGLKGLCYLELRVRTAAVDLHSSLGAIVPNPAWRLIGALSSLRGADGRVRVPGFYDRVRPPSAADRAAAARIPFDAEEMKRLWGVGRFLGEDGGGPGGEDLAQELLFRPTCTVCGLAAGYAGPGSKTVLPCEAVAKVDFRLVPDQDPDEITEAVRRHLDAEGYGDVTVQPLGNEHPYRTPLDHPFVRLVAETARQAYGGEVLIHPTSAGSGPMYPLGRAYGFPLVSTGCGYWGSRAHAPDENIRIEDFAAGAHHVALLIQRFARG
jgi:acetylornithine deacetylase/succinyl-diaminopimelate desuccinylase-like protein